MTDSSAYVTKLSTFNLVIKAHCFRAENRGSETAGQKAFSSLSTSIHTLGQIAIAKLLSPSHASHSVSLYTEYKGWMDLQYIDHCGFKGFVSNRFGRIAEIAKEFVTWTVDKNSNRLILAVSVYIQNDWFIMCSKVYAEIGEIIIFPTIE